MEQLLAYILIIIISIILYTAYRKRTEGGLFCPIVFFCIYYAYYILYPFFTTEESIYGISRYDGRALLLLGAILSIISMCIGFKYYTPKTNYKVIDFFTEKNSYRFAIWFCIIGSLAYFTINGFNINIIAIQTDYYDATEHRLGHTDQYITLLVSLLPASSCLFYASDKRKVPIIIVSIIATIIGIMGGSRYRIFMYFIPLIVFCHLYPTLKKINLKIWLPVAFLFIISMGVIERTRNYGSGLDIEKMEELFSQKDKTIRVDEIEGVYSFSAMVMDAYRDEPLLFYDVFGTALCLPLPRAIFKNKPDAQYLRDVNVKTLGTDSHGAAYLNIVEWYLALSWIGVILNGLILGMFSKYFWSNYIRNPNSIGACLFLSMFNGLGYILVSRGYLAQEFLNYVYYIPMIYWIACIVKRFTPTYEYNKNKN